MPKQTCVSTLIDNQHVTGSKTLLKSVRQYFTIYFDHSETKSARKISFW